MTQYIDKDALIVEIERRVNAYQKNFDKADNKIARLSTDGRIAALKSLLDFIGTLEVKEVDLENRTKILADIIFDAAKHGYMPYDTQDEHCAMEKARRNIIKLI